MKTSLCLRSAGMLMLALSMLALPACSTLRPSNTPKAAAVLGTIPATEGQQLIAARRAETVLSALGEEETTLLTRKAGRVAVRTLNPSPEQVTALNQQRASKRQSPVPATVYSLMVYDLATHRVASTDCYVIETLPKEGNSLQLGGQSAQYVGSL